MRKISFDVKHKPSGTPDEFERFARRLDRVVGRWDRRYINDHQQHGNTKPSGYYHRPYMLPDPDVERLNRARDAAVDAIVNRAIVSAFEVHGLGQHA